jgi:hypothetical protein
VTSKFATGNRLLPIHDYARSTLDRDLPTLDRNLHLPTLDRNLPSRDREGAVPLRPRYPNRHRLPLLLHHISNRCSNVIPIPQPPRAPMPRPSFSIRVDPTLVQSPARIRFEVGHYPFGLCFRLNNNVNMVSPHMRRKKIPVSVRANFPYAVQHRAAIRSVQPVRILVHQVTLSRGARLIGRNQAMSRNVVVPIHGTGFVAVHMGTVAGERNQVRPAGSFYIAPSRLRLDRTWSRLGTVVQHYKDILR